MLHGFVKQPVQKEIMSHEHVCVRFWVAHWFLKIDLEYVHVSVISGCFWYEPHTEVWDYFGDVLIRESSWVGHWKNSLPFAIVMAVQFILNHKKQVINLWLDQRSARSGECRWWGNWGKSGEQLEFYVYCILLKFLLRKE